MVLTMSYTVGITAEKVRSLRHKGFSLTNIGIVILCGLVQNAFGYGAAGEPTTP